MNHTNFGAIHYDIHLDMKFDYTISRLFSKMWLSELNTTSLHHLCELEIKQLLQSLSLAVKKNPMQDFYSQVTAQFTLSTIKMSIVTVHILKKF